MTYEVASQYLNFQIDLIFNAAQTEMVALMYIQSAQQVIFKGNTISDSFVYENAVIHLFDVVNAVISNNTFLRTASVQGACFTLQGTLAYMKNNTFIETFAQTGAVLTHIDESQVTIESCIFQWNFASLGGGAVGALRIKASVRNTPTLAIYNSQFSNVQALVQGGVMHLDDYSITLDIQNCTFNNITSYAQQGGIVYAASCQQITMNNITVYLSNSGQQGRIFFNLGSINLLSITNSNFQCEAASGYTQQDTISKLKYGGNSAFAMTSIKNLTFASNTIQYCNSASNGGVINIQSSVFYDYGSTYYRNSAQEGGVLMSSDSNLTMINCRFQENVANEGGVAIIDNSYLNASYIYVVDNYATQKGGGIVLQTKSYMTITNSQFNYNYAVESSAISILSSSQDFTTVIENTQFTLNEAYDITIFAMYAEALYINNCQFIQNTASTLTKNIFIGFSNVTINNTIFKDTTNVYADDMELLTTDIKGSFIHVIMEVNLTIANSQFLNGKASQGGAIYISGDSNITTMNNKFQNNKAADSGGAIYASSFLNLQISNSSQFIDNYANWGPGDLFAEYSNQTLEVSDTIISNGVSSSSIQLSSVCFYGRNITIKRTNPSVMTDSYGGSIYCQDCVYFYLNDSLITGSRAQSAGAIFLLETEVKKQLYDNTVTRYMMYNTIIQNSEAYETQGGGMYLQNVMRMDIGNLTMIGNSAETDGGAIYTDCNAPAYNCYLKFYELNTFQSNTANVSGGAIYWNDVEPLYTTIADQFSFKNNQASTYGDDVGAYSQMLIMINQTQYNQQMYRVTGDSDYLDSRLRMLQSTTSTSSTEQTSASQNNTRSGDTLPQTYIALADKYGQIVGTANLAKLSITVQSSSSQKSTYAPLLDGSTSFYSQNGMFIVSDLGFTGTPGLNYQLVFSTDGIDQTKPSNIAYKQTQLSNQSDINFQYNISLRDCQVGEQFTDTGKCVECPVGSSFSLVQMTSPGQCMTCPSSEAICNGGNNIGPQPGYWRKSNSTYVFVQCFNTNACLGMVAPENNPQGSCAEGYYGILCSECITGYSSTGTFECSLCPDETQNILRIVAIVIAAIIVVVLLIRSTLNGAHETKNVTSVYQKILLNHIQLLMVTASFEFDWPTMVTSFFKSSQQVGGASEQIFSVDCFLDTSNEQSILSPFYLKLFLFAILPFLLFCLSYGFWGIQAKRQKNMRIMKIKGISTLVILLFLVHPYIVQYVFKTFNCVTIDGDVRLKVDLEQICYQGEHYFWSLGVALPSLIAWGLGIPLFAFVLLTREQKKLEKLETRQKYGFLFRGYRLRFYYWEVVIMYRKIVLIFISAFLVRYGVITQALIVLILLIVFVILNLKTSPFQTVPLNQLETLSLATSMISVFCGMFFIVNVQQQDTSSTDSTSTTQSNYGVELDQSTELFFFAVILISNIIFFTYWVIKFYDEIRSMLIKKFKKVYILICLFGDSEKFIQVEKDAITQVINEGLREKYLDTVKALKQIYNKGQLVLNDKNLEKIQIYLDKEKVFKLAGIDFDKRTDEQKDHEQRRLNRKMKVKIMNQEFKNNSEQAESSQPQNQNYNKKMKSGKNRVNKIIANDEILKEFKEKEVIDDYIDDQEKQFNDDNNVYTNNVYQSNDSLRKDFNNYAITKENLLNLESLTMNESIAFSQTDLDTQIKHITNRTRKSRKLLKSETHFNKNLYSAKNMKQKTNSNQKLLENPFDIQSQLQNKQKKLDSFYQQHSSRFNFDTIEKGDRGNQSSSDSEPLDTMENYEKIQDNNNNNNIINSSKINDKTIKELLKLDDMLKQKGLIENIFDKNKDDIQIIKRSLHGDQSLKHKFAIKEEIKDRNQQKYAKLRKTYKNNFIPISSPAAVVANLGSEVLNSESTDRDQRDTFGYKSKKNPPDLPDELQVSIDFVANDSLSNQDNDLSSSLASLRGNPNKLYENELTHQVMLESLQSSRSDFTIQKQNSSQQQKISSSTKKANTENKYQEKDLRASVNDDCGDSMKISDDEIFPQSDNDASQERLNPISMLRSINAENRSRTNNNQLINNNDDTQTRTQQDKHINNKLQNLDEDIQF